MGSKRRLAFASDFDNTLFHHDGTGIHEEDVQAIRQWQAEGNLFGLCTGRPLRQFLDEFLDVLGQRGIRPDFFICTSGAVVADGDGRVLVSHPLDPAVLKQAQETAKGIPMVIHSDRPLFAMGGPWNDLTVRDELPDPVCLYGFTCWNQPDLLPDTAGLPVAGYTNDATVDFTAAGVSKGTGIEDLCACFDLQPQDVGRIGDSWNDIPFLQGAVYGFTFFDSPFNVRNVTQNTVHSVAEAIRKMTVNERFQTEMDQTQCDFSH